MRYFVGEQVPMSETWGSAVYPTALQGNVCKHYFEKRVIRVAWGFSTLFSEVKRKDDLPLRNQIIMRTLVVMSGSIAKKCVLVLKRNTILMSVVRGVLIGIMMGFLVKMFVVDSSLI